MRSFAIRLATIVIAFLMGFGLIEATLRAFPSLIGLNQLRYFEPSMRAEIAGRLGLPTFASSVWITSADRTDHGPPFAHPGPNEPRFSFMDKADIALGAPGRYAMDANGMCNPPMKAARGKADILVAGDSFTTCQGAMPQEGATQTIEEETGLTAYNLGIGGTGPYEYLEMLKRFARFKPRITVMNIYEGNDLRDIIQFKDFIASGGTSQKDRRNPPPAWSYAAQFFKTSEEVVEQFVKSRFTAAQDYNFRYSAPVGGHVLAMNVANKDQGEVERAIQLRDGRISTGLFAEPLKNYVDWAKANRITPIVTYIPSMYTAYQSTVTFENPEVGKVVQAFSAAQRKWLAEHAQSIGYNFLDLTPFLQEAAAQGVVTHFPSNVHLTAEGEKAVGVHTAEFIKKLGPAPAPY
jgi:hypothetical protein